MSEGPLDATEILQHALNAGFAEDDAVIMTAIALAESGGYPDAHKDDEIEDSRGLWQVNYRAHGEAGYANPPEGLFDPAANAQAAYAIWGHRESFQPWSVTHGSDPAFLDHIGAARLAASELHLDVDLTDALADFTSAQPASYAATVSGPSSIDFVEQHDDDGGVPVTAFLAEALSQDGKDYVLGATPAASDDDPPEFDCAELVRWAAQRAGLPDPGVSTYYQVANLRAHGAVEVPVELAEQIPGAVLYRYNIEPQIGGSQGEDYRGHVVISLGDGSTIEAKGSKYGVGSFDLDSESYDVAFLMPGVDYQDVGIDQLELFRGVDPDLVKVNELVAAFEQLEDDDYLDRELEIQYGTDPHDPDTDGDGLTDGYEILVLGTDALSRDTDNDGMVDDIELALGRNPIVAESPDGEPIEMDVGQLLESQGEVMVETLASEYGDEAGFATEELLDDASTDVGVDLQ